MGRDSEFRIRPALLSDLPAMQRLFRETVQVVCRRDYTAAEVADWASCGDDPAHWKELFARQHYFVAESSDVGLAGFASIDETGYMHSLFVGKEWQRRGVASALYAVVERFARRAGAERITSEVSRTARGFFERQGFVVDERQRRRARRLLLENYKMSKRLDCPEGGIWYDKRDRTMKFIAIIPARYASTRFPGKPLALLGGKPVIQRVYEQVAGVLDDAVVATDDERIYEAVRAFGGRVEMTSPDHRSGTDRCWGAYCKQGREYDVVVNVQGDEPFIRREQLEALRRCFDDPKTDIATLVKPFTPDDGLEALENPNSPKVVLDARSRALYFSRSVIPYLRGVPREEWLGRHTFYKHIGIYAFRSEVLRAVTSLPQSPLELAESLEQLRWLENGYKIGVGISTAETVGIDTPEDLVRAGEFLAQHPEFNR